MHSHHAGACVKIGTIVPNSAMFVPRFNVSTASVAPAAANRVVATLNVPVPPLAVPCGRPYWAGTTVTIGPLVYTSEHAKVVALGTVHSHHDG